METERITSIKNSPPEIVYNLSVLNDESYIANGIIVHNCRSCLIPATSKTLKDQDLLIENRDFTQHFNQDFEPLKMKTDIEQVNDVLGEIGKFNEKYRIDQFILDEDIQLRLMKLNLSVVTKIPQPELTDFTGKPENQDTI